MAIYELDADGLTLLESTTFADARVLERGDLQRVLRHQVDVIAPDTLIIAEEFGDWQESRRRVDLLGIDKDANLVVIELKRTEDGGHMELQAIRYAAMVSALTFDDAVNTYKQYLSAIGSEEDAKEKLLEFMDWEEPDEEHFAQDVRMVLASANFSKEITTAVLWLNDHGLDIRCVRLHPYRDGDKSLLDVQQVIPLPEAEEYQVRVRDKARLERGARTQDRDLTKYDVSIGDQILTNLPKRRAIFSIIHYLCASGIDPEQIREHIAWRGKALRLVPGTLDSVAFEKALADQLISERKKPQTRRFFIDDDELIHANGKTYAVTKMWGIHTEKAMKQIVDRFKDKGVSFQESV